MAELVSLQNNPQFAKLQRELLTHPEGEGETPPKGSGTTAGANAQAKPEQKPDVSKKLSEKLLGGWCLLGENNYCPLCRTPLMSKGGQLFCFGCDLPVRREEDLPKLPAANNNKEDLEEEDEEKSKKRKSQGDITTSISKSNRASTTTASVAPTSTPTPQAEHSKSGSSKDAEAHDRRMKSLLADIDDLQNLPDPDAEEPIDEDEDFEFDAEAFARARAKSDEASAKIGRYLLQGWTMMDVHCSKDNCPLMKNGKVLLCPCCDTHYEEEEEEEEPVRISTRSSEPPKHQAPQKFPASTTVPSTSAPSSSSSASASSASASSASRPTTASSLPPSAFSSSLSLPSSLPPVHTFGSSSPSGDSGISQELRAVEHELTEKLGWARSLLHQSTNIAECHQLADLIRSLLLAAAALRP